MHSFSEDTRATMVAPNRFDAEVVDGWDVFGNANGGYLTAIMANALKQTTGRSQVASITTHYLRPASAGPVLIETSIVKEGRRFTSARATMFSGDRAVCESLSALQDIGFEDPASKGVIRTEANAPVLPAYEDCEVIGRPGGSLTFRPAIMNRIDIRVHPDDAFWNEPKSGELVMRGWVDLRDEGPLSDRALLMFLDVFPPTAFPGALPVGWVPTIEMTSHVRSLPAPGRLRSVFRTRFVSGGFLEEDGELWDSDGIMVAQSRQLALVPIETEDDPRRG